MTTRQLPSAVAFVFPGQGAQRTGMGRDFCTAFAICRDTFVEASDALGFDVADVCWNDDPRLDDTEYTQPCIVTVEIAMVRALRAEFGIEGDYFGGHSLGEYSALCAAGVISLADAVRMTRHRGALMQKAVPKGHGAMLAVIAEGIGCRLDAELAALGVDVANRNSPDQIVISGKASAVAGASARLEQMLSGSEHRLVPLNVSAPFHSRLMEIIELEYRDVLQALAPAIRPERARVCTSNVTGGFHQPDAGAIVDALTRQVSMPVDWVSNMKALRDVAGRIYEVGPGRPLSGFFRAIGCPVASIISVKSAQRELAVATAERRDEGSQPSRESL
jgi:[acyl-carrier-protein] S-malonyltransferase